MSGRRGDPAIASLGDNDEGVLGLVESAHFCWCWFGEGGRLFN